MTAFAGQAAGVTIEAVVWPPCRNCGQPHPAHVAAGCPGYAPSRPVQDHVTRAYLPPPAWPLRRRLLAMALWGVERRLQGWREAL